MTWNTQEKISELEDTHKMTEEEIIDSAIVTYYYLSKHLQEGKRILIEEDGVVVDEIFQW